MTTMSGVGGAAAAQTSASGLDQLGSDAFMKLLVAQLRHQDPMNPADSTQMLQQTAMFTQVEALNSINESQQELIGFNQGAMAAGLVGQHVTGLDADGAEVTGTVTSVRFTADGPVLDTGDGDIALVDVTRVTASIPPAEPDSA